MSGKIASYVLRVAAESDVLNMIDKLALDLSPGDRCRLLRNIADACDARLEQLEDVEATDPDDGGQ